MDNTAQNTETKPQAETVVISGTIVHITYPARKTNYAIGTLYAGEKKVNFEIPREHSLELLGAVVEVEGELRKKNPLFTSNEYYLDAISIQNI